MICKSCQGAGYHVVMKHGNKYKDVDQWNIKYFEGEPYHVRICRKCQGTGETGDLIIKLAPWEEEDEMLDIQYNGE